MSTTTFQQHPPVFGFGSEPTMLPSSPSSTPPNKRSSDCGSSSGLGMASKNEVSSEASSLTSESATAPPELAFSPPVPSSNNGLPPIAPFLSPIRFMRPPPPQHLFYTVPNSLAAGAALPHSSTNVPPPTANSTTSSTTPNSNLPQTNGTLQTPSPPNAVIPGIPPNGTPITTTPGQTNDLFVHVEHGETISLLFGNEVQHIAGPATIRMVGQSGVNPPLPLHVPRGHNILQICDEKGILRHLILSPQNAVNVPSNATGLAPPLNHHLPQNLSPAKPSTTSASVSTSHPSSTTPTTARGHSPPKSTSPPNNMVPSYPPPSHAAGPNASNVVGEQNAQSFSSRKRPLPTNKRNGTQTPVSSSTDTTAFNGTPQENTITIDQEERGRLLEALNRIHQPTITRVGIQDADVHWQELDTSEAAASAGPFPQIDPSEFVYEIFLYENAPNGRLLTQKECPPLSSYNGVRLTRLKPRTEYHVAVRASLPERQLLGVQSPTAPFRTYGLVPDAPQYLRTTQRGPNYLAFSWLAPTNTGGAPILNYILQISKGKTSSDSYETVYEGPAEQARITRLEPASSYKARVSAQNESGRSDFSAPVVVNTTIGIQHQPPSLPTTSASTSAMNMSYYPVYPPIQTMGAGVHSQLAHYAHIPTSSPIFTPKLTAPTLLSASARSVRLSWQPPMTEIGNLTLEFSEPTRPFNFTPVATESYNATKTAATVSGLKSNREYRFRLVGTMANGEIVRSEFRSVNTHKDRYENTAYYQNYQGTEKDRLPAPILQKNYEDDTVIELSWKYQNYEYDTITYVLEGSTVFTSSTNNSYKDGSDLQWKVCYKGPETSYSVRDLYLVSFRVQALNKRNVASPWSEVCFAQRTTTVHRSKRQAQTYGQNTRNQYHNQTYSNQQYQTATPSQQTRQSTPPMSQKSDSSAHHEAVDSTPSAPLKAPNCTVPKLTNITQSSMDISWKPTITVDLSTEESKYSLIYELQRVDKQALIIFSGSETQFHLENLRPVEHVQMRIRAVILDYEGQRTEGDWSSIGSGITLSAVTTPPQNLRLKSEASPFTLSWDAPAQMNGSDVIEYLVNSANFAMEENKTIDSLALQQLASTERLEYSIDTLLPAHIYIFTVVSRNEAGKSAPSERLEFTSPATPPSPPIQLHLEANSLESLYATWLPSASNGAIVEFYKLTLYYEKAIVVQETVSVDTHEYLFENLEAEKAYTLEAQAKNNIGWGKPARVTCTTLQCPPEPPQLSLVQATSNTLKLKWSVGSSAADSLELLYFYLEKQSDNGKFVSVYEGENHSAKVKGLRESSAHRFRIRASRVRSSPLLAGQWSSVFTFQTLRQPPTGLRSAPTVSEISPGLLQVEWQAYNKGVRDSSGNDESTLRNSYYKLQTAPKGNKGSESWKTAYQGSSTSCTLNISNSIASTLPTTRQYRVLVVQKFEEEEEVHSLPSPIALFNIQRTPTDSPRKRSTKPTSGQSTPSSLVSARSSSNNASGRQNQSGIQTVRMIPPHKLGLYKRFKRSLLKLSISERDGAFIVLTAFVFLAIGIAFLLNFYYTDKMI